MLKRPLLVIAVGLFLLVACAPTDAPPVAEADVAPFASEYAVTTPAPTSAPQGVAATPAETEEPKTAPAAEEGVVPTVPPAATNVRVEDDRVYNFPQLLPFDGIFPVYDPQFAVAADAPLLDDELVIGIALGGESKAYPITVLRFREMVNDELAGIPILVTW